jgi:hypothetical protein
MPSRVQTFSLQDKVKPIDPSRRVGWILCLLIGVVTLIAYWPAINADFVSWDDYKLVRDNAALNPPSWPMALKRFEHPYLELYTPATNLLLQGFAMGGTQNISAHATRLNPIVFHVGMILLHLAAIPLVFLLLRALVRDEIAAALGVGVVALHPLGVEATAWVSSIGLAASVPLMAAILWQWIQFRRTSRLHSHRAAAHYALATFFYILALLIKPSNVTIPIMVWVLDIAIEKVDWKRSALAIAPWLLAAIPMIMITTIAQPSARFTFWQPAMWQRPAVASDAIVFYIEKLLWPAALTIDYGRTPAAIFGNPAILFIELTLVLAVAISLLKLRRRIPIIVAGIAIFIAALLPVLGLTSFAFQIYSTVADRYAYPGLIGVGMILAAILAKIKKLSARILVCTLLFIWAVMTYQQSQIWKNNYSLFTHTLRINPHSWMAWNSLGNAMILDGRVSEGLDMARTAWSLAPDRPRIAINIGTALAMLHRPGEALPYLQFAAIHEPDDFVVATNLSRVYSQLNEPAAAELWRERARQREAANALNQ